MYNLKLIWDLDISPIDKTNGEIKAKIDLEQLKHRALKNDDAYQFLSGKVHCPTISDDKKKFIDFYYLETNVDDHSVKIRFLEILNTMLITSDIDCNVLKTAMNRHFLLMHDSLTKGDIMFKYRLDKMIDKMQEKPSFYNLRQLGIQMKTKLFSYQLDNINWMIDWELSEKKFPLTDIKLIHFPDGRIYNHSEMKFIQKDDIPLVTIKGGIIADEAGKGKTIQMLSLCLARGGSTLVLVPDHLKSHWENEIVKHFDVPIDITIETFDFFSNCDRQRNILNERLKTKDRIIIDEFHIIYSEDRYRYLYELLCNTKVMYKWALTATPFTVKCSIHKILQYLTDQQFHYENMERFMYYKEIFESIFKRNIGDNIRDELQLPELEHYNHVLDFNDTEKGIYMAERTARNNANIDDLRQFCCDVMVKYETEQVLSYSDIGLILKDFEKKWLEEVGNLDVLKSKIIEIEKAIDSSKNKSQREELAKTRFTYIDLLKKQEDTTRNRERSFNLLKAHMQEEKVCPICSEEIDGSYCIIEACTHYYHETCLKSWFARSKICPGCRGTNVDYIVFGKDDRSAPYSTKIMKLLEIIKETGRPIIVFTQFEKIIQKLIMILGREGVNAREFSETNIKAFKDGQFPIFILSSKNNACGLDLSFVSDIVIFEPIAGNYVRDVETQIVGRIYRINQTQICKVHRLIIRNTIEEEIYGDLL